MKNLLNATPTYVLLTICTILTSFLGDILEGLMGQHRPGQFVAAGIFAALGMILSVGLHLMQRDKTSKRTPEELSMGFWFKDNWPRTLISFIFIFICLRFSSEIFGGELTMWGGFLIGYLADKNAESLQNYRKDYSHKITTGIKN